MSLPSASTRMTIDNIQNEITLQYLSTEASTRRASESYSSSPNNSQPSVVRVPTTSSSPLDKGKSRQSSSLSEVSEESQLMNHDEPHSISSLDTAASLEPGPSTGVMMSDSSSCLTNELPPSTSLPPLYSEAANIGAINVSSEDDSEDDSGSDSESNNLAPEEVEAVYNFWRQLPEEQCPWASRASLNDRLRLRGLITKPQH